MIFLRLNIWSLLSVLLWLNTGLIAQSNFEARGFTVNDGLCAKSFNSITGDQKGFLWMTSENGVTRFDGNLFFCFQHDEEDPHSIAANKCDYVLRDSKARIWVKTLYGLSLYDETNNRFINYTAQPGMLSGLSGGKMAEDHRGRLWLGGYGDVVIFDPVSHQFEKSGWFEFAKNAGIVKEEKRNNAVLEVMPKGEHEMYILSVFGLFSVNTQSGQFVYHPNEGIDDYWAFYLCHIDSKGWLWIASYDKCFYIFDPDSGVWQHKKCGIKNGQKVTDILPLTRDSLLMLSDNKLMLYRPSVDAFSDLNFEMTGSNAVLQSGSFWKAYAGEGKINLLMSGNLPFLQLRKKSTGLNEIRLLLPKGFSNNVAFHTESESKVLIGDWQRKEILLYDLSQHTFQYLRDLKRRKDLGVLQSFYHEGGSKGILVTSDRIFSLDISKAAVNEIACADYPKSVQPEFRNVVKDDAGNLYVRERSTGIWKLNSRTGRFEPFYGPNDRGNYSDLYFERSTRKFWLSQERNGVYIVDPINLGNKHYPLHVDAIGGASTINSIAGNGRGKVYLALLDHGLMEVDASAMLVKRYTQFRGLPSDNVNFGMVDRAGNYWGTSQLGLYCLSKGKISNYDYHTLGKQFFYRLSSDGGNRFFQNLHPSTLLSISPDALLLAGEDGQLYLAEMRLHGKRIYADDLQQLSHNQNSLSFRFGCKLSEDWKSPECEYALNDNLWQSFDLKNELNLFNLAPGEYRVKVRRADRHSQPLELRFSISPPWYMLKSLWLGVALVLASITYMLYHHRIKTIKEQEQLKSEMAQQISQMEMAALRAQMNPHFIFNCLNSINRFILTNEADLASDYLTRFSRLIRLVLDNSREEIIPLEKELAALKLYLEMEAMRFKDKFFWQMIIEDDIDTSRWLIAPMTLQPYVENAIWHGLLPMENQKGIKTLDVIVKAQGEHGISISIDDNGVGRKAAENVRDHSRKSHGMNLTAERLSLITRLTGIKAQIEIIDKLDVAGCAAGTTINIVLYKNEDPNT